MTSTMLTAQEDGWPVPQTPLLIYWRPIFSVRCPGIILLEYSIEDIVTIKMFLSPEMISFSSCSSAADLCPAQGTETALGHTAWRRTGNQERRGKGLPHPNEGLLVAGEMLTRHWRGFILWNPYTPSLYAGLQENTVCHRQHIQSLPLAQMTYVKLCHSCTGCFLGGLSFYHLYTLQEKTCLQTQMRCFNFTTGWQFFFSSYSILCLICTVDRRTCLLREKKRGATADHEKTITLHHGKKDKHQASQTTRLREPWTITVQSWKTYGWSLLCLEVTLKIK